MHLQALLTSANLQVLQQELQRQARHPNSRGIPSTCLKQLQLQLLLH
jgi:hypothetical protein